LLDLTRGRVSGIFTVRSLLTTHLPVLPASFSTFDFAS
jgi:hypothetical protein